ncbi:unnamed protein product, partial [Callosobruchus maculatus]
MAQGIINLLEGLSPTVMFSSIVYSVREILNFFIFIIPMYYLCRWKILWEQLLEQVLSKKKRCYIFEIVGLIYPFEYEELVALLNILEQHNAAYALGVNYNKTKVMIVDREHDNHREVKSVGCCGVVQSFVYLGSLIDNSGSCENEIRKRIQQARVAM